MAKYIDRILCIPTANYFSHQRRVLDGYGHHSPLEHLAEKSLGGNIARWGRGRLHSLVLERAAHLAKSASKLAVRCYSKSGFTYIYPIHFKTFGERGS
jgi:hypothetical protein